MITNKLNENTYKRIVSEYFELGLNRHFNKLTFSSKEVDSIEGLYTECIMMTKEEEPKTPVYRYNKPSTDNEVIILYTVDRTKEFQNNYQFISLSGNILINKYMSEIPKCRYLDEDKFLDTISDILSKVSMSYDF